MVINSVAKLTDSEQRVFNSIVEFINKIEYPPTYRELCRLTGYQSTQTISDKLKALQEKGYIEITHRGKRTLKIKSLNGDLNAKVPNTRSPEIIEDSFLHNRFMKVE